MKTRRKISRGYTVGALESYQRYLTDLGKRKDCRLCLRKRVSTRMLYATGGSTGNSLALDLCRECWSSFVAWLRTRGAK